MRRLELNFCYEVENLQSDLSVTAEIKLYYDLYIPPQTKRRAPLLIAVHGYGAHKRYTMREARTIAPADFIIVSLQAPHQHFRRADSGYKTGFGWLTDFKPDESVALRQKFVLDVIETLRRDDLSDEDKIFLYGLGLFKGKKSGSIVNSKLFIVNYPARK